jgi:hypothetical protein
MSKVSPDLTDTNAEETSSTPSTAPTPGLANSEPPTDTDTSRPPDVVMDTASDIVSDINALSSAIEDLELGNYDDSFALLLPLAHEVQQMQQEQSTALLDFSSPVTHPFDIPFAAGADELAPALDTAASIDGSRGRIAAMKVVLNKGSALVETERRSTKTLQDILDTLTQVTDRETILSDKTKLLQEKTDATTKAFLESLVF